jgi:ferredoxin-NADP reductase
MAAVMPLEQRSPVAARKTTVQVLECVPAARDAVTLLLALPTKRCAPAPYLPGQFITLAFPTAQRTVYRSYSLCGDGRADAPWEITVKRQDHGLISTYLCHRVRPGMLVRTSLPQGSFTLPAVVRPEAPLVFIAGGSGITPIMGMLRALSRLAPTQRPRVWLHYAYHGPEDAIYGRELAALDPQRTWFTLRQYVSTHGERLRAEQASACLVAEAPSAEWYVCGPDGLKRSLAAEARRLGVPAAHFHAEVFASPHPHPVAAAPTATGRARIRLAGSGAVLDTQSGETVLEALERHGYGPEFSCRAGACGTCRLRLLAGQVRNGVGSGLSPAERTAGYVLSCVAQPVGDVTLAFAGIPVATAPRAGKPATITATAQATQGRHTDRAAAKRSLRLSLTAAAASLFLAAWGVTSHTTAAQSPSTTTSNSTTGSTTSSGSASSSATNSSGNSNGSSSIGTQTGQNATNTTTGVS